MTEQSSDGTYRTVVCSNCGKGDWQDFEPGDTLRCPWCERHVELMWLSEYHDIETDTDRGENDD